MDRQAKPTPSEYYLYKSLEKLSCNVNVRFTVLGSQVKDQTFLYLGLEEPMNAVLGILSRFGLPGDVTVGNS